MIAFCGCVRAPEQVPVKTAGSKTKIFFRSSLFPTKAVEYQDAKYGAGMRVVNEMKHKPGQSTTHRCTVCMRIIY